MISLTTMAEEKFLFADKVEYNMAENYAEATGNVRIKLGSYVLYADKVLYDITKDEVWSYGNIRAFKDGKQLALGEAALLHNKGKELVISSFILHFKKSDSVIAAKFAKHIDSNHQVLEKVTYTSCPTCDNKKPLWQISAKKADVIKDKNKVVYKNVFFEIYGVPVVFLPYFSHPIPGSPPKSGILVPDVKRKRFGVPLYYRPKSNLDVTFTPRFGKKIVLYEAELRHLTSNGAYNLTGSMTHNRVKFTAIDKDSKQPITKKMTRYNISGAGDFSLSDYHYGFSINRASDRGYLKEYYNRNDPFLLSKIYLYKVENEDFIEVNNLALQGLGKNDNAYSDPHVVPELNFRYVMPLEKLGGANLKIDNYTSLYSTEAFGRIFRTVWDMNLYNTYITDMGQIIGLELANRSDLYKVETECNQKEKNYVTGRSIPEARMSVRYPWGVTLRQHMLVIEPIMLVALGKHHSPDPKKFGLIDSKKYDFDDSNFFRFNRYNGFDFHEYGHRVTYGINSLFDVMEGYRIGMFLGQFQRISKSSHQKSDIVGRASFNLRDQLEIYYRFRKEPRSTNSKFDEIGMWYEGEKITSNVEYANLRKLELEKDKISQLYGDVGYKLNENWNFGVAARIDITKRSPKQLERTIRVTYTGECVSISTSISNDYTADSTRAIRKSSSYSWAVGLKTLNM